MKINAIITAGGSGSRYGEKNKLFEKCGNSCVLVEAIKPFLETEGVTRIIVGIAASGTADFMSALDCAGLRGDTRIVLSDGGATRTQTVKNAVASIEEDADFILVHDGARPYVTLDLIRKVIASASEHKVALPLLPMTDAIADVTANAKPVDRAKYRRVQTPFCCEKNLFVDAYNSLESEFYDDLSAVKTCYSGDIGIVDGDERNVKITFGGDIARADGNNFLTGCGYDIHRMTKGDGIKLLGVKIPCEYGFVAHSDGDVPIHAVMDSVLSAIGEKDIGHLFPVDDSEYDGADSADLLRRVLDIAQGKGYTPHNLSVAIIAERPMLSPYIDEMRNRMSQITGVPRDRIGISATTNEKVGEIGHTQAIAAYSSVLLKRLN